MAQGYDSATTTVVLQTVIIIISESPPKIRSAEPRLASLNTDIGLKHLDRSNILPAVHGRSRPHQKKRNGNDDIASK